MGTEELILFSCKKSLRQAKACRRDFLTVEGWICEIDVVLFAQTILGQAQPLAEAINLSKSPGAQCLQGFWGFFSVRKNGLSNLTFPRQPVLDPDCWDTFIVPPEGAFLIQNNLGVVIPDLQ